MNDQILELQQMVEDRDHQLQIANERIAALGQLEMILNKEIAHCTEHQRLASLAEKALYQHHRGMTHGPGALCQTCGTELVLPTSAGRV